VVPKKYRDKERFTRLKGLQKSKYVVVVVNNIKEIYDKRSRRMAFIKIQDLDNTIVDLVIFASMYKDLHEKLKVSEVYFMRMFKRGSKYIYGVDSRVGKGSLAKLCIPLKEVMKKNS
jgi:DNA polymerase III alpha subunit